MLRAKPTLERIVIWQLRRAPVNEQPLLAWSVVCGKTVAEKTSAKSFIQGELQILVPDRGWQKELGSFVSQYLAGINRILGKEVVKAIAFVAAEPKKPSPERLGTGN